MAGHGSNPVDGILHSAHEQGVYIDYKWFVIPGVALVIAFLLLSPGQTLRNFELFMLTSPLWLPVVLGTFAWQRWRAANRIGFMAKQEYVLLEILVPRDVRKTPLAMETIFSSMHISPGESTWWKRIVEGRVRPWWSFEIVSIGGRVHLYVWTRVGFRRGLESYFYAQYPGIEIIEATDYSRLIDPSHAPYDMWGCDYKLTKSDAYPIRTYTEFMKPDSPLAKPEEQIDPLAQIIELLGSLSPKEQFWFQIVIRVSKGEKFASQRSSSGGKYTMAHEADAVIDDLRKKTVKKVKQVAGDGSVIETESFPNPTRGVQTTMENVERKVSKSLYDVGLRAIYMAPLDAYQGSMISHLIVLLKPFGSETSNNFGITNWMANFDDWPWEDRSGHQKEHVRHNLLDAYRRRSFFHEPYRLGWQIMNVEELATLFHIPSSGVTTPSLPRIQSSTSEAPSNLPT